MEMRTALPKNIRQIGDVRGKEKIYLEDYVMTYIRKKEKEGAKEYLGIFLGSRQELGEDTCFFIRGILEVPEDAMQTLSESENQGDLPQSQRKSESQGDVLQKTQESEKRSSIVSEGQKEKERKRMTLEGQRQKGWESILQEQCQQYFPELEVQGCCVIGTYPTERMEQLTQMIPESANLLYHLQEQEESLYVTGNGQYERVKGYFVFYEQNRNMQEYLAEVFQENSVEQESLPDRAIKSFREKVKEKSQQKNTSMLKLASSFFVVAMLVIGAIAVNRVEEIRAIRNQGGDLTAENEAEQNQVKTVVSGAANSADSTLQNTAEEEQRLVNGALMQEGDAAQIADGNSLTASQVSDSASGLADSQITDSAASQAGTSQVSDGSSGQTGNSQTASSSDGTSGQTGNTQTSGSTSNNVSNQTGTSQTSGSASDQTGTSQTSGSASDQTGTSQTSGSASDQTGSSQISSSTASTETSQESSSSSVTWQAGGPDSFWEEDLEASAGAASQASVDVTDQASADVSSQASADASSQASADASTSGEMQAQEAASRQTQAAYVIKSGDTLAEICKRYYGSLDQLTSLCEVNGITDANVIMPGQKIVLP